MNKNRIPRSCAGGWLVASERIGIMYQVKDKGRSVINVINVYLETNIH